MIDLAKLYTYACDDVRLKRKDRPEAWITADKINGQMYRSYPLFEFIPGTQGESEPLRYGDFVIDIDTGDLACAAAIKIIEWFDTVYGVSPDQWRTYLSGKKGLHLELPDEILGTEYGHRLLPLGYKRLAKDIEGELNIKLDTSMYNRGGGKPYRQPNVMRDTGTCKRQIVYSDLYEITDEDEYRAACSEPGDTWEPAITERNTALADKLAAYLNETEKQQEIISRAPDLSDDDIDRLAIERPPCVHVMANLTVPTNGATFNDIAIQLTAYAITTQITEADFLVCARTFIEGYPSTSLNTLEKRYENCRARYRTMAANGNRHSCGGVLSLRLSGFECKECRAQSLSKPATTIAVMDGEDLKARSVTLNIPEAVLNPGGLISLAMEALPMAGAPDIPQFSLPVVLSVLANSIAGKLIHGRVWPNVYNIKVGPTSLGKTDTDRILRGAIDETVPGNFYGPTGFASGPALMRALVAEPKTIIVIDEATAMFRRYMRADPVSDGIRDALLEIFSASGGKIRKVYSDSKRSIDIDYPCVSLTGNATTTIFEAIQQEDFTTGTIQRFDFWCYDGPSLKRPAVSLDCSKLTQFAEAIAKIYTSSPPDQGNLAAHLKVPYCVPADHEASEAIDEWSDICTAQTNQQTSEGERGIVSRQYYLAIKYALIHMAASRPVEALYQSMRIEDIEYGKAVAKMLAGWKLETLFNRVSQGDFHKSCELFKDAIIAAMQTGKRPTFKVMANRRPALKNWKMKDSLEVITVLTKRGEVVLDESKKPTAYYLAKG